MNFEYSQKSVDLQKKLTDFIEKHIVPVEDEFYAFQKDPENIWTRWPKLEVLKQKAKDAGLWNLFLPKDYNSIAPAKMSLIQWKRLDPSEVLIMFQHMHAGLTFNRNGDTFPDSYIVLKSNEKLLGNWTEIIFNTNWHPGSKKRFYESLD